MRPRAFEILLLTLLLGTSVLGGVRARAADLSTAPSDQLMHVYSELGSLHSGGQRAVTENVVWKRDAATFTFREGKLTFAAPVEGRVLAAVFEGQGTFELNPPTLVAQRQIARFAKTGKLEDNFREAVLFFTDNSWDELQKLVKVQSGGAEAASKAFEAAQKKYQETFNDWWENGRKGNFSMHNLAARMLADLADPSSRGFFLADFKAEHSGNLLFHISWNRDPLLLPGLGTDEEVMLLHYKHNEYWEWWAGFHLKDEYVQNPHPEHRTLLAHCRQARIDAEVTKDNHLSATAEMEFEVPGGSARLLPISLDGVLRLSSVTDGNSKKLAFIQEDRKLDSDPWVILPEPAAANKVYKLHLAYDEDSTRDSRIIHPRGTGLFYVTARESWFPSFGAFDDRSQYSLHFRSPKKFTFVATGRPVKAVKEGNQIESDWQSEIPYAVVGFNYGDFVNKSQSDANLTVTAYTGREIPDELKDVQAAIDSSDLAGGSSGQRNTAAQMGILTGGFNTAAMAGYTAGISYQALKLFEAYFGPLPFKSVSVSQQPVGYFGQSWPTLIYLPYTSLLDATTRNSLRLQETAEGREFYNTVAIHEMAHQWWGHTVGFNSYRDQWMSEGFADMSASLYLTLIEKNPQKFITFWNDERELLLERNTQGFRAIDAGPVTMGYRMSNSRTGFDVTRRLIYPKGAYILHMIRMMMHDNRTGDQRFKETMQDFVKTYMNKAATTEDFKAMVEKHMTREMDVEGNQKMDWFFNEYVYGTALPTYKLDSSFDTGADGDVVLSLKITQSNVDDKFRMLVPLYLEMADANIVFLGRARLTGNTSIEQKVSLKGLKTKPRRALINYYDDVLASPS